MAVTLCAHKIKPAPTAVLFLERNCMLDLAKLESGEFVVLIAAAMMCAQYFKCFLATATGDKPSCANPVSEGRSQITKEANMYLLGLSGTHQVKAIEIKDGKIWTSETLLQLQTDWTVSVPKQVQAAIVTPRL